jgi:hypothetical protein
MLKSYFGKRNVSATTLPDSVEAGDKSCATPRRRTGNSSSAGATQNRSALSSVVKLEDATDLRADERLPDKSGVPVQPGPGEQQHISATSLVTDDNAMHRENIVVGRSMESPVSVSAPLEHDRETNVTSKETRIVELESQVKKLQKNVEELAQRASEDGNQEFNEERARLVNNDDGKNTNEQEHGETRTTQMRKGNDANVKGSQLDEHLDRFVSLSRSLLTENASLLRMYMEQRRL